MRYESAYGSMDALDSRRELWVLLNQLPSDEARAEFLRRVVRKSNNGFADKMVKITPSDSVSAYWMLVQICTNLGVDLNAAAVMLERTVKQL